VAEVSRSRYERLVAVMSGDDSDDHFYAAAAWAPSRIVTANLTRFPSEPLAALGVSVVSPGVCLCALRGCYWRDLVGIVTEMAADRHRPKMLRWLTSCGVLEFLGSPSWFGSVLPGRWRPRRGLPDLLIVRLGAVTARTNFWLW